MVVDGFGLLRWRQRGSGDGYIVWKLLKLYVMSIFCIYSGGKAATCMAALIQQRGQATLAACVAFCCCGGLAILTSRSVELSCRLAI
jgi:hypothetical protein